MVKKILCTLGPASLNREVVTRLAELGVSLFRINLSHTELGDLPSIIRRVQEWTSVAVCLDTEGAQARTGSFVDDAVRLRDACTVVIPRARVAGDASRFNLTPLSIVDALVAGDLLRIDFNGVLLQVIDRTEDRALVARVLHGGLVGSRKAVDVDRIITLPALSEKDRQAVTIGRQFGIRHVALSFANRADDVRALRALVPEGTTIIAKIESRAGLTDMDAIAAHADALLLDRGDMSREVPIEHLPLVQERVIQRGRALGKPVYVATNLLESMVRASLPTRAEVNDVYHTLRDGAAGLVLAAETAIGEHPVACVRTVVRLIRTFEAQQERGGSSLPSASFALPQATSFLIEPHGGLLVQRIASDVERDASASFPHIAVSDEDCFDCEQIATGGFSPLTGFLGQEALESVLRTNRLPSGTVWTLPVILQVSAVDAQRCGIGTRVVLTDATGFACAFLDIRERFTIDCDAVARLWFGTVSMEHPGVAQLHQRGPHCIAGDVTLIAPLPSRHQYYALTPAQVRAVFEQKGWSRVVGFHTRNAPHRGHEYLQHAALERVRADGLFISPVIGRKKPGDFLPEPIMRSYETLMELGRYPVGKVVLGCFKTSSRYSGPREAVFTMLRHKNMGCSHFIIGRDHTGVQQFYTTVDYRSYIALLGDIGIEPVFFDAVGYHPERDAYTTLTEQGTVAPLSGTEAREALRQQRPLPNWFMREEVQELLRNDIAAGKPVFAS